MLEDDSSMNNMCDNEMDFGVFDLSAAGKGSFSVVQINFACRLLTLEFEQTANDQSGLQILPFQRKMYFFCSDLFETIPLFQLFLLAFVFQRNAFWTMQSLTVKV